MRLIWGFACMAVAMADGVSAQSIDPGVGGVYRPPYDETRGVYSYAPLMDRALQSVVRVDVVKLNDDPLTMEDAAVVGGNGSGFVIEADGLYVVTNAHVVVNALSVKVETPSGLRVNADIVGMDPSTDLALLSADLGDVPPLIFAESVSLRAGDLVFAAGYPRGLDLSLTTGILSGVGRQGFVSEGELSIDNFIQTDAAVNPGNSGGPLLDSAGRVIGITSFIISRTGESGGLNFAVPSRVAVPVLSQLRRHGEVRRGLIGVRFDTLTPDRAKGLGVDVDSGAVVLEVMAGSPAAQAGVQIGDVITGAGGVRIDTDTDFRNFWLLAEAGHAYDLYLRRGQDALRVSVTPRRDDDDGDEDAPASEAGPSVTLFLGASIFDGPTVLGVGAAGSGGARLGDVPEGSQAARLGLLAGDVIVQINGNVVGSVAEALAALSELAGETIALRVQRGDTVFVVFALA